MARDPFANEGLYMNAQQQDTIELEDFGDAAVQTQQYWLSTEYPDSLYGRGPYPGWLECSADRAVDLAPL
jgi:hypothetical protein